MHVLYGKKLYSKLLGKGLSSEQPALIVMFHIPPRL